MNSSLPPELPLVITSPLRDLLTFYTMAHYAGAATTTAADEQSESKARKSHPADHGDLERGARTLPAAFGFV